MVFGVVVAGMDVVRAIEATSIDAHDTPLEAVIVADCGELSVQEVSQLDMPENYDNLLI